MFDRCSQPTGPVALELDLVRGVIVAPPANPWQAMQLRNSPTMAAIRDGLRHAADDGRVRGLIVHVGPSTLSPAEAEELAGLIAAFGERKPTIAYAESFGEAANDVFAYRVAAACREIWLQPTGDVGIGGVHLEIQLLKGLLNKVGVEPQFGQRKEFKTAADRFAADEVTDANREMTTRLGQSIMDSFVEAVAAARGRTVEQVWDSVNVAPVSAQEALEAGLVDRLGYRDEVYAAAHERWETKPENLLFVHRYELPRRLPELIGGRGKPEVALVTVNGGIVTGRGNPAGALSGGATVGSDVVLEHLRAALREDKVKAVVLGVNSPGGSYIASDAIWRAVHQLREADKPVVAVMGTVAGSGGYYVSMGADEIVAQPSTITGSIGVLAGKFVTRELFDKLAIKREGIDIGARAGMLSGEREFTEDEWAVFNAWLDRVYEDFTTKAAADRRLPYETLEPLAHGRVWTGADARERGLIDHLGGMSLGFERACALAGLDRDQARLRRLGKPPFVEQFLPAKSSEATSGTTIADGRTAAEGLLQAALRHAGLEVPGVLTMPLELRIR